MVPGLIGVVVPLIPRSRKRLRFRHLPFSTRAQAGEHLTANSANGNTPSSWNGLQQAEMLQ